MVLISGIILGMCRIQGVGKIFASISDLSPFLLLLYWVDVRACSHTPARESQRREAGSWLDNEQTLKMHSKPYWRPGHTRVSWRAPWRPAIAAGVAVLALR